MMGKMQIKRNNLRIKITKEILTKRNRDRKRTNFSKKMEMERRNSLKKIIKQALKAKELRFSNINDF
jgi:hypothetical protein